MSLFWPTTSVCYRPKICSNLWISEPFQLCSQRTYCLLFGFGFDHDVRRATIEHAEQAAPIGRVNEESMSTSLFVHVLA